MNKILLIHTSPTDCSNLLQYCDDKSKFIDANQCSVANDCLFIVDFASLAKQKLETLYQQLQQHIPKKTTLNIHIIISKCEQVLGFEPYFNLLSASERQQILCITDLNDSKQLLQRINANLITRLHQEPVTEKRKLIQYFPAQFEKAIELSLAVRKHINTLSRCNVTTIYFCSYEQKQAAVDLLGSYQSKLPPPMTEKDYFVKGIFDNVTADIKQQQLYAKKHDKKRKTGLIITAAAMASLMIAWQVGYRQSNNNLQAVDTVTKQPTTSLAQLNFLNQSIKKLNDGKSFYASMLGLPQLKHVRQHLQLLYNTELQTHFFPYVENILTHNIIANTQTNPLELYHTLKIYLMLTTHQHFNPEKIIRWFKPELRTHINALLQLPIQEWPQNKELIKSAQLNLQQLPPATLTFLTLQEHYHDQQFPLASLLQNDPSIDLSNIMISKLYNPTQFKKIYNDEIPQLVKSFAEDNWIFGDTQQTDTDKTIKQAQKQYVTAFAKSWQKVIPQIKLKPAQNFAELKNLINEVLNPNSNLNALNTFVTGNATLAKQPGTASTTALQQLLKHDQNYQQATVALNHLTEFLNTLLSDKNSAKVSYEMAINMINHPNTNNPIHQLLSLNIAPNNPLHNWLNTIAHSSWAIVLDHAKNQLNIAYAS